MKITCHLWRMSDRNRTCDVHMWQMPKSRAATPCPHIWTAARCELGVRGLHGPHLQKAGNVVTKSSRRLYFHRLPTV